MIEQCSTELLSPATTFGVGSLPYSVNLGLGIRLRGAGVTLAILNDVSSLSEGDFTVI